MRLRAPQALLPQGWADDVVLTIDADGTIGAVERAPDARDAELARGPVVPGMPNVHSHAFQRAIAGRTGEPSAQAGDSFWTWREVMYAFVARIDADALQAVTAQAYVEMLKAGYTTVGEFHYVHHDPEGRPYDDPAELAMRVVAAAVESGIGLTLLPVFYAHAGFGAQPPNASQRRFVHTPQSFGALIEALAPRAGRAGVRLGVAPHSLRAVTASELTAILARAAADAPVHIHVAEQRREVDECVAATGQRPLAWLLDNAGVDARWCIVHATHADSDEIERLAASGAIAGLAPTTEADLGDGIFRGADFVRAGGWFGVGSDSNAVVDPFAELRLLEWSQRLRDGTRNVLGAAAGYGTIGERLWTHAARAGARAVGRRTGELAAGSRADLVVLDAADATLATVGRDALLDAAIFGPVRRPVRDVMVGGQWVVRDGRHALEEHVLQRYRATMARLAAGTG